MQGSKTPEARPPWPEDFDIAIDEQNTERTGPRTSIRSQVITTVKLIAGAGALGSAIWFIDQMVSG